MVLWIGNRCLYCIREKRMRKRTLGGITALTLLGGALSACGPSYTHEEYHVNQSIQGRHYHFWEENSVWEENQRSWTSKLEVRQPDDTLTVYIDKDSDGLLDCFYEHTSEDIRGYCADSPLMQSYVEEKQEDYERHLETILDWNSSQEEETSGEETGESGGFWERSLNNPGFWAAFFAAGGGQALGWGALLLVGYTVHLAGCGIKKVKRALGG